MTDIKLNYPIESSGETIESVHLRRPKVRDMIAQEKTAVSDAEKEVALFANLCELTPDNILDIDGADYLKIQKVYAGFLS